jgi:serine/threonine protein kinase
LAQQLLSIARLAHDSADTIRMGLTPLAGCVEASAKGRSPGLATIVIEKGRGKGKAVPLAGQTRICFGRDASCDVCFEDGLASRQHFCIQKREDRFFVVDLGSRNGTHLNGEQVTEHPLSFGDLIVAGETVFSFVEEDEAKARGGLVGKTIAGYRVEERLGRGGMGVVYLASQLSLGRQVALKILSSRLTRDPALVRRFVEEARSAGRLNHPNIVRVDDVGECHGLHYIAMEYLAGGSMEDLLNHTDRILPVGALSMMQDVARGLQYAESQGIVHRDIKPDNLMLDRDGRVKICDLGIAIFLDANVQREGNAAGTPHYMAPEQARGKAVDHRADIYSLGCTLYRMLSGQMPFTGATYREIIKKQVTYQPPALHTFVEEVSPRLSQLVERMMAKAPEDRPANATDLLREFDECLSAEISEGLSESEIRERSVEVKRHLARIRSSGPRKRRKTPGSLRKYRFLRLLPRLRLSLLLVAAMIGLVMRYRYLLSSGPTSNADDVMATAADLQTESAAWAETESAKVCEKERPDGVEALIARYREISLRYPGTRAARVAEVACDRLERKKKLTALCEAKWLKTRDLAQKLIDVYRFGDAVETLKAFRLNYLGLPQAGLAEACIQQVHELAVATYERQATTAREHETRGDYESAAQIYENVRTAWGLEPFVSEAKAQLAAIQAR